MEPLGVQELAGEKGGGGMTVIKVRRGINGFKYSACDENGYFIGNFNRLSEIRNHWRREIGWGKVVLVRELDRQPDMAKIEAAKKAIDAILKGYAEERRCRCNG